MAYADAASTASSHALASSSVRPEIHTLHNTDIKAALNKGVEDFKAIPTQLVFLGLLYPVIGFVAARTATEDLLPLLFPLLAGLSLMGPVMAVGLYELSRRREAGEPVSWLNAFDVLRSPGLPGIIALGLVLFFVFAVWVVAARGIYYATIGTVIPGSIGGLLDMIVHSPGGRTLIVIGNLVGFLFAVFVLAISVVSFPMMIDRACTPALAVQTSLGVVFRNPMVMAVWGLTVAALLILGSIPFLVGLAVVMPILGHATWHLYRRAVG